MYPAVQSAVRVILDLEQVNEADKFLASLNGQKNAPGVSRLLHAHLAEVFVNRQPTHAAILKYLKDR